MPKKNTSEVTPVNADNQVPVSNSFDSDQEIAKLAEKQKRETGQSQPDSVLRAQVEADRAKLQPGYTMEQDMVTGHVDTAKAKAIDAQNTLNARQVESDRLQAEANQAEELADNAQKAANKK